MANIILDQIKRARKEASDIEREQITIQAQKDTYKENLLKLVSDVKGTVAIPSEVASKFEAYVHDILEDPNNATSLVNPLTDFIRGQEQKAQALYDEAITLIRG